MQTWGLPITHAVAIRELLLQRLDDEEQALEQQERQTADDIALRQARLSAGLTTPAMEEAEIGSAPLPSTYTGYLLQSAGANMSTAYTLSDYSHFSICVAADTDWSLLMSPDTYH